MNQYSVTVMPISLLKCSQKHLVVYCLAVKWKSLWPGSHVEICWGNTKHCPPAGAQPIGKLSLSEMTCDWSKSPVPPGLDVLKPENRAMRMSRSLVFSQDTWITICWESIMGFFSQWCQKRSAYWSFKHSCVLVHVSTVCQCLKREFKMISCFLC